MTLVMRLDKKVRCFTYTSTINAMKKVVVVTRSLIMMVMIVAGFLLVITNSLNHSALGLIDGTENDDVLIANMSIFSSRSSNNFSISNTEDRSGLMDTMSINDSTRNDRNSPDNDSGRGVFMYGNYGNDEIHGTDKSDHLRGGPGNDIIYGYGGGDYIEDGDGNDTLYGGDGDDVLVGGSGTDYFDCGEGHDIVEDFHPEEGDIALSNCEELLDEVYNR
jgi:Ca2+-binding RTX toxin-like protein